MMATTATRNPTDTMMPSRVKKERSLLVRIASRASRSAAGKGMLKGNRWPAAGDPRRLLPVTGHGSLVAQRLDRIEPARLGRRIHPEEDPGHCGGDDRGHHGPERPRRRG